MSRGIRVGFAAFLSAISLVILGLAVHEYRRDTEANELQYTRAVKKRDIADAARNALAALEDAEVREQDYVLTGETVYSEAYADDVRKWQDESASLELVARNDPATPIIKEFSEGGTRTLDELALVVSLYEKSGRQAALDRIGKSTGIVYLDLARGSVAKIEEVDGTDLTRNIIEKALSMGRHLTAAIALLFIAALTGAVLLLLDVRRAPTARVDGLRS